MLIRFATLPVYGLNATVTAVQFVLELKLNGGAAGRPCPGMDIWTDARDVPVSCSAGKEPSHVTVPVKEAGRPVA